MKIASGLYFTETPHTKAQAEQVAAIFSRVRDQVGQTSHEPRVYWTKIFEQTRTVLSPAQMQPLEAMRAEDELSWRRRKVAEAARLSSVDTSRPPAVYAETHLDQNANNPEIQLLVLASKRAQLAERNGPFYFSRGLPADQVARLDEALARRIEEHDDLDAVGRQLILRSWTSTGPKRKPAPARF